MRVGLLGVYAELARGDTSLVVPPLPLSGPYPVGCSNVMQDFSRAAPSESAQVCWEGLPRDHGTGRYTTDLLADPADTPAAYVTAPGDRSACGSFAGRTIQFVVPVCYPASADNPRADYELPTGESVPRMQRDADPPLWPDSTTRFPLLPFSHGYLGSPLWLSVTAPKTGTGVYSGTLYRTTGPAFNAVPFNPASVMLSNVGTATFSDSDSANFAYTVNGMAQMKAITRQVFPDPGTVCQ